MLGAVAPHRRVASERALGSRSTLCRRVVAAGLLAATIALLASTTAVSAIGRIPATPSPAIVPPPRSGTVDAPVPLSLLATLGTASTARPLPYYDGCHGAPATTTRCFYGNLRSKTTIALFGDSHALSWFPAVLRLAQDRGWRVLSLTRSACGPADIVPYNRIAGLVMRSCQTWRAQAIARLVQVRPAIILVTGTLAD